jgi:selenocysteine lyase/cysteine desulfurase
MLENYFKKFRKNIIGIDQEIETPFGKKKLIYADWTASGRLYKPIEDTLNSHFYPFVANTHTETTITGALLTKSYKMAQEIIKHHVNADVNDAILTIGSGMTSAVCKLQRMLGLRVPEQVSQYYSPQGDDRPIVFVTHMEHHSNHTSWIVSNVDVVHLPPNSEGLVDPEELKFQLSQYKTRKTKIGAFTACANVTGIKTNYHELAKIMHQSGGICFVDFAASAPYVKINMHPEDPEEYLDAIYFSPHKFLGGPGSSGVLVFNKKLYTNKIPDKAGGGTVKWTNRWGEYSFYEDVEVREDGGTPGFLQAIRAALSIKLKEDMGVENILKREEEILNICFNELGKNEDVKILAENIKDRIAIISFNIEHIHYNLIGKLLNDMFGIQSRGGCSCAGTYGHYLFDIDFDTSHIITDEIEKGILNHKPGWVRVSFHPTMTNQEVYDVCNAINYISKNITELEKYYNCNPKTKEYTHKDGEMFSSFNIKSWFELNN